MTINNQLHNGDYEETDANEKVWPGIICDKVWLSFQLQKWTLEVNLRIPFRPVFMSAAASGIKWSKRTPSKSPVDIELRYFS